MSSSGEARLGELLIAFLDAAPRGFDAAMDGALEGFAALLECEHLSVGLLSGTQLRVTHEWCAAGVPSLRGLVVSDALVATPLPPARLRQGSVFAVADTVEIEPAPLREFVERLGVRSLLALPLERNGEWIGTVTATMRSVARPFGPESEQRLAVFASVLASHLLERRAVERAAASERSLRAVLDALPIIVFQFDGEARFLYSDGAGLARIGRKPGESVGHTVFELYGDQHQMVADTRRVLAGETVDSTVPLRDRLFDTRIAPVRDPGGQVIGGIGMALDVTDKRALETRAEQAQRLEAIARLSGGIAHDFNNLLTVLGTHVAFALDTLSPEHPARIELAVVQESAARAVELTRRLLAFAREHPAEPIVCDLCTVVRETVPVVARIVSQDVEVSFECEPGAHVVRADPAQIEQVLVSLAMNARDALGARGVLAIRVRTAALAEPLLHAHGVVPAGFYVQLQVTDDGVGIPSEALPKVFDPFFTTKPRARNTGLGLTSVHGIAHKHGGHVTVQSARGQGTTVAVYLPQLSTRTSVGPTPPTGSSRPTQRATILVVEDETGVRRAAKRILDRHGFRVLTAASAEEALEVAAAFTGAIDVLFTDVVLPGPNGPQLAKELRLLRPGIRVLYTTGYADEPSFLESVRAEGADLVVKPWVEPELLKKLRAMVGQ